MTMIELLVAVSIMVVMMLAFSQILQQSRKVVSNSQLTMRYNSAATAILHTIRSDVAKATRQGMLSITQTAVDEPPVLLLTAAGVTPSKTVAVIGSGAFATYGMCENKATAAVAKDIFFCQRWVLNDTASPSGDVLQMDLAEAQIMDRLAMNDEIVGTVSDNLTLLGMTPDEIPANEISIPPTDIGQVQALWQVLSIDCRALSIMWTDGTTGASGLNWYGIDYTMDDNGTPDDYTDDNPNYSVTEQGTDWSAGTPFATNPTQIEFDAAGAYRALWTHHNQNNWPLAIKIRFELLDTRDADKPRPKTYEVICPLAG